jgi:diguanylate cyclase (GGDEF)-like protein
MNINHPVAEVMHRELLECSRETPVGIAAARMRAAACGSILVVDSEVPCGIWTASDALVGDFDSPADLTRPVAEVMSSPVAMIASTATIGEAARRFHQEGIHHLLVVDGDGRRCGMISQTDVVRHQGASFYLKSRDVGSVARRAPVVVDAELPLAGIRAEMRRHQVDALAVFDRERFGIVTGSDVVGALADGKLDVVAGAIAHFPLLCIARDDTLFAARRLFTGKGIRHLGVTDDKGNLVSLLSFSDILDIIESDYVRDLLAEIELQAEQVQSSRSEAVRQAGLTEAILSALPIGVEVRNESGEYLFVNQKAAHFLDRPVADLVGRRAADVFPELAPRLAEDEARLRASRTTLVREESLPDGRIVLAHQRRVEVDAESLLIHTAMDVTDWKRADALMVSDHHILELIASGEELPALLEVICQRTETHLPGGLCAIHLLDADGVHLRDGAAPSLPAEFRRLSDGQSIGATAASTGTAVHRGEQVFVDDIAKSPLWADQQALAESFGLRACWATPLFSAGRRPLGAFAVYFREPQRPEFHDLTVIAHATRLTAVAIERWRQISELRRLATTDSLTGVNARANFLALADAELRRAQRFERELAVLMVDLDNFKRINDAYGHAAGDETLRTFARVFREETRTVDLLGRIGGEEFAALLPETGAAGAAEAAERLRLAVERARCALVGAEPVAFTISIGVAVRCAGDSVDSLLARADRSLYRAKHDGRNRVDVAGPDG